MSIISEFQKNEMLSIIAKRNRFKLNKSKDFVKAVYILRIKIKNNNVLVNNSNGSE